MPAAKPSEFRRRAVESARRREKLIAAIAADLGIAESCLRRWMKQDDIDAGRGLCAASPAARPSPGPGADRAARWRGVAGPVGILRPTRLARRLRDRWAHPRGVGRCPTAVREGLGSRFRWLTAPRSTVVQPGPVHTGLTEVPDAEADRVLVLPIEG